MKLKLTVESGSTRTDVMVSVDATATAGQVADRLRMASSGGSDAAAGPVTLRVTTPGASPRVVDGGASIADAGIRSGDVVAIAADRASDAPARPSAAVLSVLAGPDAGRTFTLATGMSLVGRDRNCTVRLTDPQVSKRHLRVNVSDLVEVIDENSANGVQLGGTNVQRAVVRPGDELQIGESRLSIGLVAAQAATAGSGSTGHTIEFNRSPRLDPRYPGVELVAPEPPARTPSQRFPLIPLLAPLMMAGVMYAITKSATSILFVALTPLMLVGTFLENRMAGKKAFVRGTADFRAALQDLAVQLQYAADLERTGRRREHPSIDECVEAVSRLTPLTWTRRPRHDSFLQLRLGLGSMPSRNTVKLPSNNHTTPELWRELNDVAGTFAMVDRVPVVASLRDCGGLGIAGPSVASHPLAAAVVAQLVGLHSPAEVVLAAITSSASRARWEWLKWLPHVRSEQSPLASEHLTASTPSALELLSEIEALVEARSAVRRDQDELVLPAVVLLVEDDAAQERARLVQLAEHGPSTGVFVIWVSTALERVPAPCRAFLEVDPNTGAGRAGFVDGGVGIERLELEPLADPEATLLGRRLAPLVDAGAVAEDDSDLPRTVSFLALAGLELATSPDDVVERWRGSNSLPPAPEDPRLKQDNTLKALVGQGVGDRFYLDLRTHGPHALVGGTTGAGKSEFLQSWILGMAVAHSPARVNFLFVDYKGGAAFADCVNLPHCVGLVTDLSPHLVRRALRSLHAELRRREHVLNRKKAKDLLELERRRDPDAPPSLVIVVDEFAALVTEVPEFVDGVVNIAQRGRSLGLHLILATQRPAGVIRDNLRANTNLRVALRMADEADSDDVIGTSQAAGFDPALPGRGIAKTGPGRLTAFQSAYVGGITSGEPAPPSIEAWELPFGLGARWEVVGPEVASDRGSTGPNDIARIVTTVGRAAQQVALAAARRPWLPELAPSYRLEELPTPRTDRELVFGVIDRPDEQAQPVVAFRPDEGNMAVYGTGGSGKSTFLRSLAVAAAFAPARGGPCTVYGIDFGARGLQMLDVLPHVGAVINGDDTERIVRLLRLLRTTIDERAERYAQAGASTIDEYRVRSGKVAESRILLLIDNFGAFRQAYEMGPQSRWFDTLLSIAADGRGVGVHVVVSADRPGAIPASLSASIQRRLVLRLTSEMDYSVLNTPADVLGPSSPPGRGFLDDGEVQVGVLSGDPNVAVQTAEIAKLAAAMRRAGVTDAPSIASLPEVVLPADVVRDLDGAPILGIWDETLAPIAFEPHGVLLVTGPPQSGRTNALAWIACALGRLPTPRRMVLFASRRSPLGVTLDWHETALTPDDIAVAASELTAKVLADDPSTRHLVVVIEAVGELLNGPADLAVQDLVKACRTMDRFVVAEGETSTLSGSWPLLQAVKASRTGIALQPEQVDGDNVFKTSFPRTNRAEYPPGRGLFVRSGRVARVQIPLVL